MVGFRPCIWDSRYPSGWLQSRASLCHILAIKPFFKKRECWQTFCWLAPVASCPNSSGFVCVKVSNCSAVHCGKRYQGLAFKQHEAKHCISLLNKWSKTKELGNQRDYRHREHFFSAVLILELSLLSKWWIFPPEICYPFEGEEGARCPFNINRECDWD